MTAAASASQRTKIVTTWETMWETNYHDGSVSPKCPCCGHPMPASLIQVYLDGNVVAYNGKTVQVTGQCAVLAKSLADRMPAVVSRPALMQHLWGCHEPENSDGHLQVLMCALRKKLRPIGLDVQVAHKRGYRLVVL